MQNLDKTDRQILTLLQRDHRLSASEIAEQVGLSQSPCWRRINRMQEEGYITGAVATLRSKEAGFKSGCFLCT